MDMQRHWKKIVIGIVGVVVAVLAGTWVYVELIRDDPPPRLTTTDLDDALASGTAAATAAGTATPAAGTGSTPTSTSSSTPTSAAGTAGTDGGTSAPTAGVDGTWTATGDSVLRYRVQEVLNGFDTEGVGETNAVTGSLTIGGTQATAADFTVDMTTFVSDSDRRDGQFRGRIMDTARFPTGTFVLTSPIEFGAVPADGEQVTVQATGELTLRGTTRPVTFDLTASLQGDRIGVLGTIPVVFEDYGIPDPSFGTISTDDEGLLEFILVFERTA